MRSSERSETSSPVRADRYMTLSTSDAILSGSNVQHIFREPRINGRAHDETLGWMMWTSYVRSSRAIRISA